MRLAGHVVTPSGLVAGVIEGATRVAAVTARVGAPDRFILPGFIDVHCHGGDGGDVMDGPEGLATAARFHLAHGTTTWLPTTITSAWPEIMAALRTVAEARDHGIAGGALVHGAHLEGPFINPERLGAQPPFAIEATPGRVDELLALDVVRLVTLAPEIEGAAEAASAFARAGVRVGLGHSAADYDTAVTALAGIRSAGGVASGTHLFNAMGGIAGRAPGLAGALLASGDAFVELILDGHHVHPGAMHLALAAASDRLMLVTDAMRGAGRPDGPSTLGRQEVTLRGGAARLADGTLAGSILTMKRALSNALRHGVGIVEAAALTSGNAARFLGLADRGVLVPGRRADCVVLDAAFALTEVWLGGERVA